MASSLFLQLNGGYSTPGPVGIGTTDPLTAGRALTVAGGTQTTAVSPVYITQTVNAAAVAFPGIKFVMTEGGSGTAVGTNLLDLWYGTSGAEATKFRVDRLGTVYAGNHFIAPLSGGLLISARGGLRASADGEHALSNNANTGETALNLGPATGNTANGTLSIKKAYLAIDIATDTACAGKGTATITMANAIPAGSLVLGVDLRVTTILAGSDGLATFGIGYGGAVTAWGATIAKAATTTTGIANFVVTSPLYFTAATNLLLTGTGGKVIDSGAAKITIYYIALTPAAAG